MSLELVDAAWMQWRRGGLGASDIAAVLGLSSYASPVSLYFEKCGLLGDERTPDSQRQRIGKRMEAVLAAEFNEETGLYVVGEQTWCEHVEHRWARCTVDGLVAESPITDVDHLGDVEPIAIIEFKTDARWGWPDGIPANIRSQVIWQMGVTGMRHAWVVVMFSGFRIETHEVVWDSDAQADWGYAFEKAEQFWTQNVLAGIVPPMDDHEATTRALTDIYDADPEGVVDIDDEGRSLIRQVRAARTEVKVALSAELTLKNELRAYLGDNTTLIDGWTEPGPRSRSGPKPVVAASWREQQTTGFDKDAARKRYPRLVDKFTTHGTARVLRVNDNKEIH